MYKIEIIDDKKCSWINRKDLEIESGYKNQARIYDKFDTEKQKYRQELISNAKFQPCRVFIQNDLVERKIKSRRVTSKQFLEFKEKLLGPYKINFDEQDIISALQVAFEREIKHTYEIINTVFKTKDLIFTFLNTNLEQKMMNMDMQAEILMMSKVDN